MIWGLSLRRLIIILGTVAVLSALFLIATRVGGVQQREETLRTALATAQAGQDDLAGDVRQAYRLVAESLATQAAENYDTNPDKALKQAILAVRVAQENGMAPGQLTPRAQLALWQVLAGATGTQSEPSSADVLALMPESDGRSSDRWLVTYEGNQLALWDLRQPQPADTAVFLQVNNQNINPELTRFSGNGQWLALMPPIGAPLLWSLDGEVSAEPTYELDSNWIQDAGFSPDGRWFALGNQNGRVYLWDLQRENPADQPQELHTGQGHDARITQLLFRSDSRWLATADERGRIILWNLTVPQATEYPVVLKRDNGTVEQIAFREGETQWLTAVVRDGARRQVYAWNLNFDELLRLACAETDGGPTAQEVADFLPDYSAPQTLCPD